MKKKKNLFAIRKLFVLKWQFKNCWIQWYRKWANVLGRAGLPPSFLLFWSLIQKLNSEYWFIYLFFFFFLIWSSKSKKKKPSDRITALSWNWSLVCCVWLSKSQKRSPRHIYAITLIWETEHNGLASPGRGAGQSCTDWRFSARSSFTATPPISIWCRRTLFCESNMTSSPKTNQLIIFSVIGCRFMFCLFQLRASMSAWLIMQK